MSIATAELSLEERKSATRRAWDLARRHPTAVAGALVLALVIVAAVAAPYVTPDPLEIDPVERLRTPAPENWFGTDNLGRDIYSRTLNGGRVSLVVGFSVALLASAAGLLVGLLSGFFRAVDAVAMRVMDGLMSIPEILLAIALVSITSAKIENVIIAITIPEVPRIARLVRSVVLSIRDQPYVQAAVSVGSSAPKILFRHVLPNTMPPVLVQATYVCASAIITEALLGFIGAGTPPEIPSWGNVMATGRTFFQIAPWIIFFPGLFLTATVLAVNVMGDGLRDMLDPRLARQMKR